MIKNNKGFAVSSIIYSMLVLFLALVLLIMSNLASRKAIFDKQKSDILDKIGFNTDVNTEINTDVNVGVDNGINVRFSSNASSYDQSGENGLEFDNTNSTSPIIIISGISKDVTTLTTYDFYIRNDGAKDVWLRSIDFNIDVEKHAINIYIDNSYCSLTSSECLVNVLPQNDIQKITLSVKNGTVNNITKLGTIKFSYTAEEVNTPDIIYN